LHVLQDAARPRATLDSEELELGGGGAAAAVAREGHGGAHEVVWLRRALGHFRKLPEKPGQKLEP
jgi:hypothetical protein